MSQTEHIFARYALTSSGWVSNARVEVAEDGTIARVTPLSEAPQDCFDLLISGIPNLHSHAFQWLFAGLTEYRTRRQDSFWSWRERMYSQLQQLTPDDIGMVAQALYVEMLEAGYTMVGEFHYLHNDLAGHRYQQPAELSFRVIEAAIEAGIDICHLPVFYRYAGFGAQPLQVRQRRFNLSADHFVQLVEQLRQYYRGHPGVTVGMAPHSLRAVEWGELTEILAVLAHNLPVHIHIAEQQAEVEQCVAHTGTTPVTYLYDHLAVDQHWCLVHATQVTVAELSAIARSAAVVGLCPATEANLGDGIFPLAPFRCEQGRWGLGSDSHISINPPEELRWLEYGQRLLSHERAVYADQAQPFSATNLLQDAIGGGLQALGASGRGIELGVRANLVGLRVPDAFTALGPDALLGRWLYASNRPWVDAVMVGGKWRVEAGRHPLHDIVQQRLKGVIRKLLSAT